MLSKQSEKDLEEIGRLLSGGDPDFIEDDPADFDPPPPIPAADAAAAEKILQRHEKDL